MLFFSIIQAILCFDAQNVLVKEWDVYEGTSREHQNEILYSFEFHLNKTSGKTIITIWKSNEKAKINFNKKTDSCFGQFEISYTSENSGIFIAKTDEKLTSFSFATDDFSQYSTRFLYSNYIFKIIFISEKIIEITVSDVKNVIGQYVAFASEPIKETKIDPLFDKMNNKQDVNMLPSMRFVRMVDEFIYKNKSYIYFALLIFTFQITFYLIIRFIKSLLAAKAKTNSPKVKKE